MYGYVLIFDSGGRNCCRRLHLYLVALLVPAFPYQIHLVLGDCCVNSKHTMEKSPHFVPAFSYYCFHDQYRACCVESNLNLPCCILSLVATNINVFPKTKDIRIKQKMFTAVTRGHFDAWSTDQEFPIVILIWQTRFTEIAVSRKL